MDEPDFTIQRLKKRTHRRIESILASRLESSATFDDFLFGSRATNLYNVLGSNWRRGVMFPPLKGILFLCFLCVVSGQEPTAAPTAVPAPTISPSTAAPTAPTNFPTSNPTLSPRPTNTPTAFPTVTPTLPLPTSSPSNALFISQPYKQNFFIEENRFFSDEEIGEINDLYTEIASMLPPINDTNIEDVACAIGGQTTSACNSGIVGCNERPDSFLNDVEFTCFWQSNSSDSNVAQYAEIFVGTINDNIGNVTDTLIQRGVNITAANPVILTNTQTLSPTVSFHPTVSPTSAPSVSAPPSALPSSFPSGAPIKSLEPSSAPTIFIETVAPAVPPGDNNANATVIAPVVVTVGLACLFLLALYYRRRKRLRQQMLRSGAQARRNTSHGYGDMDNGELPQVSSPGESIMSKQSFISEGEQDRIDDASVPEDDGTKDLKDEFDGFKNQNVEDLRMGIEGNISGVEEIVSAAVTAVHLEDEDLTAPGDLQWGAPGVPTAEQVEAAALCDVDDWMKRHGTATVEAKRVFFQQLLNKMVATVRNDLVAADDGSRIVHECAALLGLPLANKLPFTTLLVSGMRKNITEGSILQVMREFGTIDKCCVATRQRGFAIVRYRRADSVDKALNRFRNGEVVVQDVAVQMKALMPSGEVRGRVETKGIEA